MHGFLYIITVKFTLNSSFLIYSNAVYTTVIYCLDFTVFYCYYLTVFNVIFIEIFFTVHSSSWNWDCAQNEHVGFSLHYLLNCCKVKIILFLMQFDISVFNLRIQKTKTAKLKTELCTKQDLQRLTCSYTYLWFIWCLLSKLERKKDLVPPEIFYFWLTKVFFPCICWWCPPCPPYSNRWAVSRTTPWQLQ